MQFRTVSRQRRRRLRCTLWTVFVVASVALVGGLALAGMHWGLVALAAAIAGAGLVFADRWMRDEGGVPVLFYHSISDHGWVPWPTCIVGVETFESHLRMLARSGFSVMRARDIVAARLAGKSLPARPVALTFDDGYLDNWVAAHPLLRRHGMPATLAVSLDFIEDGEPPRPTLDDGAEHELRWTGYVNWTELRAMQDSGVWDIQAHGIDHGRVETGPHVVEHLDEGNWRRLAWMQWRRMAGTKVGWNDAGPLADAPLGSPVHESAPAFAAREWRPDGTVETQECFHARMRRHLVRSRQVLQARLGQPVDLFVWPENGTCDAARLIAAEVGYAATTAGMGENRRGEDARVLSRLGVGDRVIGWRCPTAEAWGLYAAIRVFQGNYYWYFLLVAFAGLRRLHRMVKRG